MNNKIEKIRKTRNFLLTIIKELTIEQLNTIPEGFSNNIIWNLGHLIAAQQGVCYVRAGLDTWVDEDFFNSYKPGSKPERKLNDEEVENIKELFFSSLDVLEKDYEKNFWSIYPSWNTRYGITISSIDEAIEFLQFHEGLHTGYIMAMKKVV